MKREKEIKKSLLALLILMIGAPLWAKYPQNPHWKPKKKTAANSEHPLSLPVKFSGAGWDPAVAKAIQSLIDRDGKNSPRYNPQKPRLASGTRGTDADGP